MMMSNFFTFNFVENVADPSRTRMDEPSAKQKPLFDSSLDQRET